LSLLVQRRNLNGREIVTSFSLALLNWDLERSVQAYIVNRFRDCLLSIEMPGNQILAAALGTASILGHSAACASASPEAASGDAAPAPAE